MFQERRRQEDPDPHVVIASPQPIPQLGPKRVLGYVVLRVKLLDALNSRCRHAGDTAYNRKPFPIISAELLS